MAKIKEILIIVSILIITLILVIIPIIINNGDKVEKEEEKISNLINIEIYGEINYIDINNPYEVKNNMVIKTKSGITYGQILSMINLYLTKYSIIEDDLNIRYFKDTKLLIKSSNKDINREIEDIDTSNLLNINEASKAELMLLYGIGDARSDKILNYIKENGKILDFIKLKEIIGTSDEVIEKIKEQAILK